MHCENTIAIVGRPVARRLQGGYTAEWIVEAYTQNDVIVSLANYGSINFSGLTTSLPWSLKADHGPTVAEVATKVSAGSS